MKNWKLGPPVLVGEKVAWLGSGSGLPRYATVKWIGKIPEISSDLTAGIELDEPLAYGGIDGTWGKRRLFSCDPKCGLLVPMDSIIKQADTKNKYEPGRDSKASYANQILNRQKYASQSKTAKEFLSRVLPQPRPQVEHRLSFDEESNRPAARFKTAAFEVQHLSSGSEKEPAWPREVFSENENFVKCDFSEIPLKGKAEILSDAGSGRPRRKHRKKERIVSLEKLTDVNETQVFHVNGLPGAFKELNRFKKNLKETERKLLFYEKKPFRHKSLPVVSENPESLYRSARLYHETISELNIFQVLQEEGESVEPTEAATATATVADGLQNAEEIVVEKCESLENAQDVQENEEIESANPVYEPIQSDLQGVPTPTIRKKKGKGNPTPSPRKKVETKKIEETDVKEDLHSIEKSDVFETKSSSAEVWRTEVNAWHQAKSTPSLIVKYSNQNNNTDSDGFIGDFGINSNRFSVQGEDMRKTTEEVRETFKQIDEDDIYEDNWNNSSAEGSKKYDKRSSKPANESSDVPGREKSSKIFSFLRWFKKNKEVEQLEAGKASSVTSSPLLLRSRMSSCGSIDTLFSIATVSSFAFVPPSQYQLSHVPATHKIPLYEPLPEEAPQVPINEGKVDLIQKYGIFGNGDSCDRMTKKSYSEVDDSFTSTKRKKRKAPDPPTGRDASLPATLEHRKVEEDVAASGGHHRRTLSESFKDKKAGAYCHVQGKRRAPSPPTNSLKTQRLYPVLGSLKKEYPTLSKKKRPAPKPPEKVESTDDRLVAPATEEYKPQAEQASKDSSKEAISQTKQPTKLQQVDKITPPSPGPLRPWYKRSVKESSSKRDIFKNLDKKKGKENEDWMPEVGFSRPSFFSDGYSNKFNIFLRMEKNNENKKEEKRKSQVSMLANISELDREAAEIIRKEQALEKKTLAAYDAKFYSDPDAVLADWSLLPIFSEFDLSKNESTKESPGLFHEPVSSGATKKNFDYPYSIDDIREKLRNSNKKDKKAQKKESIHNETLGLATLNVENYLKNWEEKNRPTEKKKKETTWICSTCTLENLERRMLCGACGEWRPSYLESIIKTADDNQTKNQKEINLILGKENYINVFFKEEEHKKEESKAKKLAKAKNYINDSKEFPKPTETKSEKVETVKEKKTPEEPVAPSSQDLDEIRKKRLNYFKTEQSYSSVRDAAAKNSLNDAEKLKLKEMLKEMKNSLPSNEKKIKMSETALEKRKDPSEAECNGKAASQSHSNTPDRVMMSKETGAIKKEKTIRTSPEINSCPVETAEAFLVIQSTVLEDIKIKDKREKVSSSAQTSQAIVKKMRKHDKDFVNSHVLETYSLKQENGNDSKSNAESIPPLNHTYVNLPGCASSKDANGVLQEDDQLEDAQTEKKEVELLTNQLTHVKGLAEFRADVEASAPNTNLNTLHVNKLLRRLEAAIVGGQHLTAAGLAKELARMKIKCSVTREKSQPQPMEVNMYIEDKVSHRGPIPILVTPCMTVTQLKIKIEQDLKIPVKDQRWILGRQLAKDDSTTLKDHGVDTSEASIFLYVVTQEEHPEEENEEEELAAAQLPLEDTNKEPLTNDYMGKGWYYNYEEDHYSYCEDSEDDGSEEKLPNSKTNKAARDSPKVDIDESKQRQEERGSLKLARRPTRRTVFDLIKPEMNETLKKDLKVISVNAVKETIEKLNRIQSAKKNLENGTLPTGWKCGLCTLVNPASRPGCAACTAERPLMNITYKPGRKGSKSDQIRDGQEEENGPLHYLELVNLDRTDLVPNADPFDCPVCFVNYSPGEGVVLRECLHTFCRACLVNTIKFSEEAEVKCPFRDNSYSCDSVLQQREIRALVPRGIFEQHLAKSVSVAENMIRNAFHCKTPDCTGWCIFEDNVNHFRCPVCNLINCLTCQAIHEGVNCKQYQEQITQASETNVDANRTREMLEEMVERGEALICPTCQVVLMKKWGCDWLRCSMCKTEICWVTRGPRWGPGGKGDTSGGCQCGINGIKCHPKCNYCH